MIDLILVIVAVICFALATIGVVNGRINLVAAGLLALSLRELV